MILSHQERLILLVKVLFPQIVWLQVVRNTVLSTLRVLLGEGFHPPVRPDHTVMAGVSRSILVGIRTSARVQGLVQEAGRFGSVS